MLFWKCVLWHNKLNWRARWKLLHMHAVYFDMSISERARRHLERRGPLKTKWKMMTKTFSDFFTTQLALEQHVLLVRGWWCATLSCGRWSAFTWSFGKVSWQWRRPFRIVLSSSFNNEMRFDKVLLLQDRWKSYWWLPLFTSLQSLLALSQQNPDRTLTIFPLKGHLIVHVLNV